MFQILKTSSDDYTCLNNYPHSRGVALFGQSSLQAVSNLQVDSHKSRLDWFPTLIKLHFRYAYYVW